MADFNWPERNQPTLLPWLIGLVVLGLLMWGIAELVNTDRDNETMAEADSAGPAATAVAPGAAPPPAAAPAAAPAAEQPGGVAPEPVGALMPLGIQDVGQRVSAAGVVLGTPAGEGFWLRTENRALIWVRSSQRVKSGQVVQETGTLQQTNPGEPGAALDAEVESAVAKQGLAFAPGLYLDASPAPARAPGVARAGSGIAGAQAARARATRQSGRRPGRTG